MQDKRVQQGGGGGSKEYAQRETGDGSTARGRENSREAGKWEEGGEKLEVE